MVSRFAPVLGELCLLAALAVAFAAMLVTGPRAGRVARAAVFSGCAAALVAAVVTRHGGREFLFLAYRVDALSQLAKVSVLLGALLAASASYEESRFAGLRTTSPFFLLATTMALVLAVSTVDLLALPLVLCLAAFAAIVLASSVGSWAALAKVVRRALSGWLGAAGASLVGAIIVGAAAETTRLAPMRWALDGTPRATVLAGLVLWCAAPLWLVAVAPAQLRRLADDPANSNAAPVLAGTALIAAGGVVLLRAVALAFPGLPDLALGAMLALAVAPALVRAATRFARSYAGRARLPASVVAAVALLAAVAALWAWFPLALQDL